MDIVAIVHDVSFAVTRKKHKILLSKNPQEYDLFHLCLEMLCVIRLYDN